MSSVLEVPQKYSRAKEAVYTVLHDISWEDYEHFDRMMTGRHVRLTYDRGRLSFMTIGSYHGWLCGLFNQFVIVLTDEYRLPRRCCDDMTCKRSDLQKGLEPDHCYYITNESATRGKKVLDLDADPPPDLAIEVDVSPPRLGRESIYEALGVGELWRFRDGEIHCQVIEHDVFIDADTSKIFHGFRPADLKQFLKRSLETDDTTLMREFRDWLRNNSLGADSKT
ncbi:Uma2 family endonuclease [Stratiformator vulcanicus]|uniref:Putative restriction endonuclease domain-containing protein n=1 Tax=Stratiformator vulcanicus TaxID=2527980 RepID=A0A517R1R8_9PLAN|nr:Uma2 family endonuclease [Stratiformator vulcanicus]QDT37783.1 hypothetical protein Pan189_21650 [Stratiformator vulcanicus]